MTKINILVSINLSHYIYFYYDDIKIQLKSFYSINCNSLKAFQIDKPPKPTPLLDPALPHIHHLHHVKGCILHWKIFPHRNYQRFAFSKIHWITDDNRRLSVLNAVNILTLNLVFNLDRWTGDFGSGYLR